MNNIETVHKELNQYLTFILKEEEYGVHILKVMGIQGWKKTTPIPNMPDYILGVINLRGEVVPIIDLRRRFGMETAPNTDRTVVIIVKVEQEDRERTLGLMVDEVADVKKISQEEMKNKPDIGGGARDDVVRGLAIAEDKMVIILEIDKLINWDLLNGEKEKLEPATNGMKAAGA